MATDTAPNTPRKGKKAKAPPEPPQQRWSRLREHPCVELVRTRLPLTDTHSGDAIERCVIAAERLEKLFAVAPSSAVDRFLAEVDTWEDRLDRWATLHTVEALAGFSPKVALWPGWVPGDVEVRSRPLRGTELGAARLVSLHRGVVAATVGVATAGADSGELHRVLPAYFERDASGVPQAIALPGEHATGGGPAPVYERVVAVPRWCRSMLRRRLELADVIADRPMLYDGVLTDPSKVQSCLLMRLGWVLQRIGLDGDKTVKPLSIRNGAGRELYDAGGDIEAVAETLGMHDITKCMRELGLRPRPPRRR